MNEQQWEDGYKQIKEYFQKNGHTLVPVKEGSLGIWVRTQRKDFKYGKLSQKRKDLLDKVDFKWKVREDSK